MILFFKDSKKGIGRSLRLLCLTLFVILTGALICHTESVENEDGDKYIWDEYPLSSPVDRTQSVKAVYKRAKDIAMQLLYQEVDMTHLAYAIFEYDDGIGCVLVKKCGGSTIKLRKAIVTELIKGHAGSSYFDFTSSHKMLNSTGHLLPYRYPLSFLLTKPMPSKALLDFYDRTLKIKNEKKSNYLIMDFLIAALEKESKVIEFFNSSNITFASILGALGKNDEGAPYDDVILDPIFTEFGEDMTSAAKQKKLIPIIGRDMETIELVKSLILAEKNNVILVGPPGVGKTAIVEGLANRLIQDDVPEYLKKKKLISIDITSVIAGTTYRGQLEARLTKLLNKAEASKDVILFIDEIHTILTYGKSEGSVDFADMLKSALERGKIKLIGATTTNEYVQHVEKEPAFARRFRKVVVNEASQETTISILRGLKDMLEAHHGIRIIDNAIVSATIYSAKYVQGRFLPDKAIDMLDKACAIVRLQLDTRPEIINQIERFILLKETELSMLKNDSNKYIREKKKKLTNEIEHLKEELRPLKGRYEAEKAHMERLRNLQGRLKQARTQFKEATFKSDYDVMSYYNFTVIPQLEDELKVLEEESEYAKDERLLVDTVDSAQIAITVSKTTGIPITRLTEDDKAKLLALSDTIKKRVIGQDHAVEAVAKAVINSRLGLSFGKRPVGSFLLLGPTGVGKTELAKTLADEIFKDQKFLIRFDMSEFMHEEAVNRFIGSSPGYVGYEAGGQLTEAIRNTPNAVVLFDEFEKAHEKIALLLLQVFDDARITDGQGVTVDCSNAIFIMTSNLGAEFLAPEIFDENKWKNKEVYRSKKLEAKRQVLKKVRESFPPEFLNRIDKIEIFEPLSKHHLRNILILILNAFSDRLEKSRGITINFDDYIVNIFLQASYNPSYGARPLARFVDSVLGSQLAKLILSTKNSLPDHSYIYVTNYNKELESKPIVKSNCILTANSHENNIKENQIKHTVHGLYKYNSDYDSTDSTVYTDTKKERKDNTQNETNVLRRKHSNTDKNNNKTAFYHNNESKLQQLKVVQKCNDLNEMDNEDENDEDDEFEEDSFRKVVGRLSFAIYDKNEDGEADLNCFIGHHSFFVRQSNDLLSASN